VPLLRAKEETLWLAKLAKSSHEATADGSSGSIWAAITKPRSARKSRRFRHIIDFLIALHSPTGVVETGLPICLPEKASQNSPSALRGALSPVQFEGKNMRNCGHFTRFSG
jgi:hypothetical protein